MPSDATSAVSTNFLSTSTSPPLWISRKTESLWIVVGKLTVLNSIGPVGLEEDGLKDAVSGRLKHDLICFNGSREDIKSDDG